MTLPRVTTRRQLIERFQQLGWDGPRSGGKHQFMVKGQHKVRIPNPHRGNIEIGLLSYILEQAGINKDDWT